MNKIKIAVSILFIAIGIYLMTSCEEEKDHLTPEQKERLKELREDIKEGSRKIDSIEVEIKQIEKELGR